MAGYSRDEILARMQGGSITLGWGAVAAFDRARLNNMLEQQYLSRLHEERYLPDFFARFKDPQQAGAYVQLSNIEFGTPRLSFESASINDSRATLHMNIIGGQVATYGGAEERLLGTSDLSEGMGFSVDMAVNLALVEGRVDTRGTVSLDLARGSELSCNLPLGGLQAELNQQLQAWFSQLPAHRTAFSLGVIDFVGDGPLTPTSFIIRTQAAPGAKFKQAENFGDGAVLTFIQVKANTRAGDHPGTDFPYLIPDDQQGSDARYSATVVVAQSLLDHVADGKLQILGSLLFPGSHTFNEVDRDTPHDLAVFGNISPLSSTLRVVPSLVTLRPNGEQAFQLLDANGTQLTASGWTALSLNSHQPASSGSITSDGKYTAAKASNMGHETLTVVVTATYIKDKKQYKASARVFVMLEEAELLPRIATYMWPDAPVALLAGHAGAGQVAWGLAGPAYGELAASENGAVFTAHKASNRLPIALQRVKATLEKGTYSGILLVNARFPVPGLNLAETTSRAGVGQRVKPGEALAFEFDQGDLLPGATQRWRVLGAGSITEDGKYTASGGEASGADAVVCDLERNEVTFNGAYQLLQLSEEEPESKWKTLQTFTVTLPSSTAKPFANGYQQIEVKVEVETVTEEGQQNAPLTPKERASIVLAENDSDQAVRVLDESVQGIEAQTGTLAEYAVRATRNVFRLAGGSAPGGGVSAKSVVVNMYLHILDPQTRSATFYARFKKQNTGEEFSSTDKNPENGRVTVAPRTLEREYNKDDYRFVPERVKGAGDAGKPEDYWLNLKTRDYWRFEYAGGSFVTHEFLGRTASWGVKADINKSMVRYENDHPNEIMVSYTGSIFKNWFQGAVYGEQEETPETPAIVFDLNGGVKDEDVSSFITNPWGETIDSNHFSRGEFVITNDRLEDATYMPAEHRKRLSESMVVKFLDEVGNQHHVNFYYDQNDVAGHRDIVRFNVVKPK
ncbi:hypothetical protein F3J44_28510 [Pantoea sp. Tr-811]|uniref:hypothetical protein n=1 Tax=Pantoea sp. Tr-811 TaxID=2608361 RepID=UPI0014238E5A|nr:hypothetical protein [Pantoea sp. Tr-811]NIF30284.1 hypothetical protein [Pantoea sp. Tr-811]